MKYYLLCCLAFIAIALPAQTKTTKTENVIIVTFDGYRWEELFTGAEKRLIESKKFVKDIPALKAKYWAETPQERREKLMPFFWTRLVKEGTILGNKNEGCHIHVSNRYRFSYPGYNEIFTGYGDPRVNSNNYRDNPNLTIFDLLQGQPAFKNRLAAFATWDAFPRIINEKRNNVPVYVNYKTDKGVTVCRDITCESWKTVVPASNPDAATDTMTYQFAKEYLYSNHPRVAFIGFDETDHYGHEGKYDAYLNTANMMDRYMEDLWNFIQSDPQYKDKTTLIITCDHGRGSALIGRWRHHGVLCQRAKSIWIAAIGPDTPAAGEVKNMDGKLYQKQISPTIAQLLGLKFFEGEKIGKPIKLLVKQ